MRSAGLAAACTAAMLCAARRPQLKVRLLLSTATPFSSMARISASNDSGTRPFCQAWPSMKRLVAIESPRIAVARPVPSMNEVASSPAASRIAFIMDSAPRSMSPFITNAATGWT